MRHYDVAVVGGGLVGCAAAYYLSTLGARVLLVDRGDLNRAASGRNAGSLHFQLEYRLVRHGDALAGQFAQIIPLTLVAMRDWAGLERALGSDLEVGMHGGLIVAESTADLEQLEQRQALHGRWGLDTRILGRDEVRRKAPYLADTVIGASYCGQEGHANPRLVTLAFAQNAIQLGTVAKSHTRVVGIERGDGWHLHVQHRDGSEDGFHADKLLNAAGAWCGEVAALAHLHLPIFPVPLILNVVERTAKLIPHLVQHASRRLSVKQVADGNVLVGGGWPGRLSNAADPGQGADVVPSNAVANIALAARLVPALQRLHLLRSWAGITGITADEMPLLGEVPEAPGFYVAGGGAAFTHGPTYARLISECIVDGRASSPIDLYSPARFGHINSFMTAGGQ